MRVVRLWKNRLAMALASVCLCAASAGPSGHSLPLSLVRDIPAGPPTGRFDYASVDPKTGRLFVADLAHGCLLAFDIRSERLIKCVPGFPSVHGVLAVPDLGLVFASATGAHQTDAVDETSLQITGHSPSGRYPDGIAWDPRERKVFVSDETGGTVAVLDAEARRLIASIPMGGEVGNTQYDGASGRIYSNVQTRDELVGIDPVSHKVVSRDRLPGCQGPHGLLIDTARRLAFIACEDNARLVVFSLGRHARLQEDTVGRGPDVLAYDPGQARLYVASESGVVSVFRVEGDRIAKLGEGYLAQNAHVVAVDATTHRVFFPLRNVGGKAVLRVMAARDPQR